MRHFASPTFWDAYKKLPDNIRALANKNYELLKENPQHPSLHFKKLGRFWSVRIGLHYRALAVEVDGGLLWFWIGSHADYDALIKG
jgi:mRNA-degrading endonuclease RelE of RelBE toxin-antitoxin system